MAKASALLVAVAACGSLPVEASHMKRLNDGPLVAFRDDGRLLVGARACADSSCMSVLSEQAGRSSVTIEPLATGGWYLVRVWSSSRDSFGEGQGSYGTAVHLGVPPQIGCAVELSSDGCNYDRGECARSDVEVLPGGDGASLTTRTTREEGPIGGLPTRSKSCTHFAIGPHGCESHKVDCP